MEHVLGMRLGGVEDMISTGPFSAAGSLIGLVPPEPERLIRPLP
jgi:hypothetical protein